MKKVIIIPLYNLFLFLSIVAFHLPPWRWPSAWRQIQADHEEQVRRDLLTLRLAGKVRQDEDGRLWSINKESEAK